MARKQAPGRRKARRAPAAQGTAKVFWSGRSQAIRLPREFRLSAREVRIHRDGENLVLEPLFTELDDNGWPVDFWRVFGELGSDFELGDRLRPAERHDPLGEG